MEEDNKDKLGLETVDEPQKSTEVEIKFGKTFWLIVVTVAFIITLIIAQTLYMQGKTCKADLESKSNLTYNSTSTDFFVAGYNKAKFDVLNATYATLLDAAHECKLVTLDKNTTGEDISFVATSCLKK